MKRVIKVFVVGLLLMPNIASANDRVDSMSYRELAREAKRVAAHGGVLSTRWGAATPYMKALSKELLSRSFSGDDLRWATCVVDRESGFNPGAVSRTDDHGLPQINRPSHSWVNYTRLKRDPAYAVAVMVRLSRHGQSRSPWSGGSYNC